VEFIYQYKSRIAINVIGSSAYNSLSYSTGIGRVYRCFKLVIHSPATNTNKNFCLVCVNYVNWWYRIKISSIMMMIIIVIIIISWPSAWNIIAVRRAAPDTAIFGRTARQISKPAANNTCDFDRRQAGKCQTRFFWQI